MARGAVEIEGLDQLTRSFSRFPKDVRQNINNASRTLAKEIADESRKTAISLPLS